MEERMPPFSEQAERAAVGALILDGYRLAPIVKGQLRMPAEAFFVPATRKIFEAVMDLMEAGDPIDPVTIREKLTSKNELEAVGGTLAMDRMAEECVTPAHGEHYLEIVRQKWILRSVIDKARELEEEAMRAEKGDELLLKAPGEFLNLVDGAVRETPKKIVMDAICQDWRLANQKKRPTGLGLPWERLNRIMGGLKIGLHYLAGRPGSGKTSFEDQFSMELARQGMPVARITLDSTADELYQRSIARKAGVSLWKLNSGFAFETQLALVEAAAQTLADAPFWVNDRERTIDGICGWLRMMKARHGIVLGTVDYIQQVMSGDPRMDRDDQARISYCSGQLKALALELRIPILCLSQMNRSVEKGGGKPRAPTLSDLRGSGSLEQDADSVVFLYPDLEPPENTMSSRVAEVADVVKLKNGRRSQVKMWFYGHYFKFEENLESAVEEWTGEE